MSYLSDASLVMIPSGYKDGTLYSAKPTNGDGDFTFSRGSNLAATRVNSEGLIEKGRENLLLQSNTFNTTWTEAGSSDIVTSGFAGYDGTNNAWQLEHKGSQYTSLRQTLSSSGVQTYSLYAKAGTLDYVIVYAQSSVSPKTWFNLSNGTIGTQQGSTIDASIESVGNGWYRCTISFNDTLVGVRIYPNDGNGTYGTTSGTIYIQDAQLELGLVATNYIETTTTTAQAGILEDMPRLDYSGGASCPSLLLEPSATALNQQSEYYDTYYTKENITISSNDTTSPEGVANASKINETASTTYFALSKGLTISSGSNHTISVFAKADERNFLIIRTNLLGSNVNTTFNLSTGVVTYNGHTSASIESYSNGWYRCSITASSSSTSLNMAVVISNADVTSNVLPTYLGVAGSGLHIYGMNVMASGYLQSYIPTYGSSVTRSVDSCSKTGISSLIGQTEGTLFFEFEEDGNTNYSIARGFSISDGTYNNRVYLSRLSNGAIYVAGSVSGSSVIELQEPSPSSRTKVKAALAYANNDYVLYVNGSQKATDTAAGVPSCSNIYLGQEIGLDTNSLKKPYNQVLLFKTRLTNDELASLTTI